MQANTRAVMIRALKVALQPCHLPIDLDYHATNVSLCTNNDRTLKANVLLYRKDKYTIHSKAVVCQDVELKGDITIGAGTVVHPKASIFAIAGPIFIGSNNIIEEAAVIVNRRREPMRIGDDNLIEIGARVECPSIGDRNTISTKARVHYTVRLGSFCVVGPRCLVVPVEDEVVENFTVFWGPDAERRTWSGRGRVQEADLRKKHGEYLRDMLPKFNRLRRGDVT